MSLSSSWGEKVVGMGETLVLQKQQASFDATKCALLAVEIVAIKAVFKDLLLKDMSVTALLTLMHFSLSVICVYFLTKSLFVQRETWEKQVICIP